MKNLSFTNSNDYDKAIKSQSQTANRVSTGFGVVGVLSTKAPTPVSLAIGGAALVFGMSAWAGSDMLSNLSNNCNNCSKTYNVVNGGFRPATALPNGLGLYYINK